MSIVSIIVFMYLLTIGGKSITMIIVWIIIILTAITDCPIGINTMMKITYFESHIGARTIILLNVVLVLILSIKYTTYKSTTLTARIMIVTAVIKNYNINIFYVAKTILDIHISIINKYDNNNTNNRCNNNNKIRNNYRCYVMLSHFLQSVPETPIPNAPNLIQTHLKNGQKLCNAHIPRAIFFEISYKQITTIQRPSFLAIEVVYSKIFMSL